MYRILQVIPGGGDKRPFSRRAEVGTPGSVQLEAITDGGEEATVDFTLTAGGQLWMNTRSSRGHGSKVVLLATLDVKTGVWNHDVDAEAR